MGEHLYIIQMGMTGAIKIGRSSDPEVRLTQIQTGCPYRCRLILVAQEQGWREKDIHRRLRRYRTGNFNGEWFTEQALGELPTDLYEMFPVKTLEMVNGEWWRG